MTQPVQLTFPELIENRIIRKEIINKIESLNNICNLSKTSKNIYSSIQKDKIKKNVLSYDDRQHIIIEPKKGISNNSRSTMLKNIEFKSEEEYIDEELENPNDFWGETISRENCIKIIYSNGIRNIDRKEHKLFIEKLVDEINLNSTIRSDAVNLEFKIDLCYNFYMVLYAIKSLKHQNIRRIKIPECAFLDKPFKYRGLRGNIFGGFPKFHQLEITAMFTEEKIVDLMNNKIFDHFLRELSKRKNATLILPRIDGEFYRSYHYIFMIMKISKEYNIKIVCDVRNIYPLIDLGCNFICPFMDCMIFPISRFVKNADNELRNEVEFMHVMNSLQSFYNLESLTLEFEYFNTKKDIKIMRESDITAVSLRKLRSLKKVKIYVSEYFDFDDHALIHMYRNNLKFISSLMPRSVEIFELVNGPGLTKKIVESINRFMPKIKIFMSYDINYIDKDCLMPLKKLRAFVGFNKYPEEIPKTVKLLAIGHWDCTELNHGKIVNHSLIKNYSEKFSKCLQNDNGTHIFFNDIKNWNTYKHLIQKYYFT